MNTLKAIEDRFIQSDSTILQSLKQMESVNIKLLLVFNRKSFVGVLSIGDIQKAIIENKMMETHIAKIMRKNFVFAKITDDRQAILKLMQEHRIECMPLLDGSGQLVSAYLWNDLFSKKQRIEAVQLNLPVVIMAGGIGKRLRPLTNVLPKPLIPIGEKTLIEDIFERFSNHGCNTFYVSVNYKADLIEYYIRNQKLPYNLTFFKEELPMGTAGSLSLLKEKISDTFFVSNCDIIIEQDYSDLLNYHRSNKNEITIVAALMHIPLAYGKITTGENGRLKKLIEKPELTFKINCGMYILEPHLLFEIPNNQIFHITHLIDKIMKRKGNVGVFPISEKSWKDIGNWEQLKQHLG